MQFPEPLAYRRLEIWEVGIEDRPAPHDQVGPLHVDRLDPETHGFAEASPHPVACDGVADGLGHSVADTGAPIASHDRDVLARDASRCTRQGPQVASVGTGDQHPWLQAAIRLRPFWRRARSTACPPRVRMRRLKPCFL